MQWYAVVVQSVGVEWLCSGGAVTVRCDPPQFSRSFGGVHIYDWRLLARRLATSAAELGLFGLLAAVPVTQAGFGMYRLKLDIHSGRSVRGTCCLHSAVWLSAGVLPIIIIMCSVFGHGAAQARPFLLAKSTIGNGESEWRL